VTAKEGLINAPGEVSAMSTPDDGDMILEVGCLGDDLYYFLKSGARPLRKITVKHKDCGLFSYEAEYIKEFRDEWGRDYLCVVVRDRNDEEVTLAQFCKWSVEAVEDKGPVNVSS
jgi:hypothetical protein